MERDLSAHFRLIQVKAGSDPAAPNSKTLKPTTSQKPQVRDSDPLPFNSIIALQSPTHGRSASHQGRYELLWVKLSAHASGICSVPALNPLLSPLFTAVYA